ncbi:MAG: ABA4-like family protein [Pirellulales bacterium]
MDFERAFSLVGMLAGLGWLLLILLPWWRWTTTLITSVVIPGLLAFVYLVLFCLYFASDPNGFAAFNSLAGVKSLFQNDGLLLAGWIHYLCFDLFIGSWEVRDSQRLGISHLIVVPCLLFTFMLGPVGLLGYLVMRGIFARRCTIDESLRLAPAAG